MLLSRFFLNGEGRRRKISILRSASASISHLKTEQKKKITVWPNIFILPYITSKMMHFFCRRKDLTAHWVHMRGFLVPTHLEKTAQWVLPTLQTKKLQVQRSCPPFSKVTLPELLPKKWVWVTSHWTKTPKVPRKEVWPSVEAALLSQRLWTTIKPRYFF